MLRVCRPIPRAELDNISSFNFGRGVLYSGTSGYGGLQWWHLNVLMATAGKLRSSFD
jgi:hypothetical protein